MKNKIIYTLFALILASCELTEQPTSYYEMDSYFVTEDKAKMAVVGIYDCIETIKVYNALLWSRRYVYGKRYRLGWYST